MNQIENMDEFTKRKKNSVCTIMYIFSFFFWIRESEKRMKQKKAVLQCNVNKFSF